GFLRHAAGQADKAEYRRARTRHRALRALGHGIVAFRLLGEIARGEDPSEKRSSDRAAMTFRELCDLYLAEGVAHKKPSTIKSDMGRIKHHLIPLLGSKRADAITIGDIERLLINVAKGRTAPSKPGKDKRKAGSVVHGGNGVAAQCVTLAGT